MQISLLHLQMYHTRYDLWLHAICIFFYRNCRVIRPELKRILLLLSRKQDIAIEAENCVNVLYERICVREWCERVKNQCEGEKEYKKYECICNKRERICYNITIVYKCWTSNVFLLLLPRIICDFIHNVYTYKCVIIWVIYINIYKSRADRI